MTTAPASTELAPSSLSPSQSRSLQTAKQTDLITKAFKLSPQEGLAALHSLGTGCFAVISRLEEMGYEVPTDSLANFGLPANIESDTLKGRELGAVLRNIMQGFAQYDGALNWVFSGLGIKSQVEAEDWKTLGFSSRSQWQEVVRPGGMSRTQSTNLLTFWNRVFPAIVKAEYDVVDVVSRLERTSIEKLVALLNLESVDARGVKVVCYWIVNGDLTLGDQIDALKQSPAFRFQVPFMDLLAEADLDPVQVYIDLTGDAKLDEKLSPMAQFATSGDVAGDMATWVDNMRQLPADRVSDYCSTPHGKTSGSDDPTARKLEAEIEKELMTLETGDYDRHTKPQFQYKDKGDGYAAVRAVLPMSELRRLWSQYGVEFIDEDTGRPVSFRDEDEF